ncbi:hypothetical protein GCM10023075_73750 [Streptosporangium album]|nr:pullulanase-associated domain-containing protein [Streptosporangium album]
MKQLVREAHKRGMKVHPTRAAAENIAIMHYHRPDGNYEGWGLHLWGMWPLPPSGPPRSGRPARTVSGSTSASL